MILRQSPEALRHTAVQVLRTSLHPQHERSNIRPRVRSPQKEVEDIDGLPGVLTKNLYDFPLLHFFCCLVQSSNQVDRLRFLVKTMFAFHHELVFSKVIDLSVLQELFKEFQHAGCQIHRFIAVTVISAYLFVYYHNSRRRPDSEAFIQSEAINCCVTGFPGPSAGSFTTVLWISSDCTAFRMSIYFSLARVSLLLIDSFDITNRVARITVGSFAPGSFLFTA